MQPSPTRQPTSALDYVNESGQESAAIGSTTAAHEHPGLRRPQRAIPHQSAASFEPGRFDMPAGGDRGSNLSAPHRCCSRPPLCGPRAISNRCAGTRVCPLITPNVSQPLVNTDIFWRQKETAWANIKFAKGQNKYDNAATAL